MLNARIVIYWTIMLCYAASPLTCVVALFRGWRAGHPFVGPKSVAYLSPFANLFLGLGFLLSGLGSSGSSSLSRPWLRILLVAAGVFQFVPAWTLWKRQKTLKASSSTALPSS
jgi:hypothetical protein